MENIGRGLFQSLKTRVQNLKLRVSWGKLGNQNIDDYLSLSTYALVTDRFYMFDGNTQSLFTESVMGNDIITWETSTNLDFGVDVNMLNNRLEIIFDWCNRTTDDILLKLEAPSVLGIKPSISNTGKVRNRGWEISMSWHDRLSNGLNYHVGFMLSDVKNKILDLKGYKSPSGDLASRIEGQPIDALFGWKTLGLADTEEKYEKYRKVMETYNPNFAMGDVILVDLNNDGKIGSEDKTVIGNQIPRFTYSINLGFDYKGFDFFALFQGVGKVNGFIGRDVIEPLGLMSVLKEHYTDSFDPANPQTGKWFPRMTLDSRLNYNNMEHWVQDASYIRLKNLQVGYSFKFNQSFPIKRMRVYFSGQNLFTITNYKIFDPENALNTMSFPNVAVYSFGTNI
ncbi:MAG: TonB-dependent receptor, partial [Tannerellaceae bacterium]|nr:TonB-dependent receptor [Tannerellaceae bacterium]